MTTRYLVEVQDPAGGWVQESYAFDSIEEAALWRDQLWQLEKPRRLVVLEGFKRRVITEPWWLAPKTPESDKS
jgi:hypothetical protein